MDNDEIEEVRPAAARPTTNPDRTSSTRPSTTISNAPRTGVVQPTPQALPKRTGPASIIVSPRQKGNKLLELIRSVPWEYGDILADYVLGTTTCALFLSLKYHRLHPEYVYKRIRDLQGKYLLRIVLVLVDIPNHQDSLRELSKTSLINNVTLILCWSAAEGARYLELFKSYEHAAPTAIRQHQSAKYADRMVDFITTPRSINKSDAVALVSQFGSVRTAVNAGFEEVAGIAGWGEKKVKVWCGAVREPFRVERAAKRKVGRQRLVEVGGGTDQSGGLEVNDVLEEAEGSARLEMRTEETLDEEDEDSLFVPERDPLPAEPITAPPPPREEMASPEEPAAKKRKQDDELDEGVMAALNKLRKQGG